MGPITATSPNPVKDCFTLNISYVDNFFTKVEDLKTDNEWKHIILLGEQALNDKKHILEQRAHIHAELSSCSFYLGEYDLGLEHAGKCLLMSKYLNNTNQIIRALYLTSAHNRALAGISTDPQEKKEFFDAARSFFYKALEYVDQTNDEQLKAQVYFNGAAAYADDPDGDLNTALTWYQRAMNIFERFEQLNDYNCAAIRLGKLSLKIGKLPSCRKILDNINLEELSNRTAVHFKLLKAQYLIAIEEFSGAREVILDALENANKLEMKTDIKRLELLLNEIKDPDNEKLIELHVKA